MLESEIAGKDASMDLEDDDYENLDNSNANSKEDIKAKDPGQTKTSMNLNKAKQ